MIADVKLALQKEEFILLLSIHPSVRMSVHTNVNILRHIYHGSVILLHTSKTIRCINIIPWANESV